MGCPIQMVGSICVILWDMYVVLFCKMDVEHQDDIYFLGVEKYFYFLHVFG
jgi:hypothetical protein